MLSTRRILFLSTLLALTLAIACSGESSEAEVSQDELLTAARNAGLAADVHETVKNGLEHAWLNLIPQERPIGSTITWMSRVENSKTDEPVQVGVEARVSGPLELRPDESRFAGGRSQSLQSSELFLYRREAICNDLGMGSITVDVTANSPKDGFYVVPATQTINCVSSSGDDLDFLLENFPPSDGSEEIPDDLIGVGDNGEVVPDVSYEDLGGPAFGSIPDAPVSREKGLRLAMLIDPDVNRYPIGDPIMAFAHVRNATREYDPGDSGEEALQDLNLTTVDVEVTGPIQRVRTVGELPFGVDALLGLSSGSKELKIDQVFGGMVEFTCTAEGTGTIALIARSERLSGIPYADARERAVIICWNPE